MPTSSPAVTLVVPLFNEHAEVLEASLRSVAMQSFEDFECIVIDESTDAATVTACVEFCRTDARFRRLVPSHRIGLSASLNMGIEQARACLIARFDSDDLCMPNRLEIQLMYLTAHPDVDVVGGSLEIFNDQQGRLGTRHYPEHHHDIVRKLQLTTPLAHPTVMIRRRAFERCGTYDPTYRNAEDLDLWLRFANQGVRFGNVPDVLVCYRQQATSRAPRHWQFNLRARIRNFKTEFMLRRIVGIVGVFIWTLLPTRLQERTFRRLLLRRRDLTIEA